MKYEFEKLAGYEVTTRDYLDIIEPMYMATDLDKSDFVKCLDRNRFDKEIKLGNFIKSAKKYAEALKRCCGHWVDTYSEEHLNGELEMYAQEKYGLSFDADLTIYFHTAYEFPSLQRGCTYPVSAEIIVDGVNYETIKLF